MTSTVPLSPSLRKAAILVSTLDTRSADALLDKMPPETADVVRQLVMELDDVSPDEQNEVIREFMRAGGQVPEQELDGVELDPSLVEKLHSSTGYREHSNVPAMFETPPPFHFLRDATTEALARHLDRQRPQLIAMVVSHLPPRQAADVLKRFTPKLQADVLRRVSELDVADQEVVRDVERELELLLRDDLRLARNRQQGLATVSTILAAAGSERHALLQSLSAHQGDLATELHGTRGHTPPRQDLQISQETVPERNSKRSADGSRSARQAAEIERPARWPSKAERTALAGPPTSNEADDSRSAARLPVPEPNRAPAPRLPLTTPEPDVDLAFEELAQLGDEDWAVLIRAVDPQVVLLALTGASESLLRSMTRRLSKREAQAFHSRLQKTGPLRLSDIEQSQRHVARQASRLAAGGKIRLPPRRNFAAAA